MIVGFEVEIQEGDVRRWCYLQDTTGRYGDAGLGALKNLEEKVQNALIPRVMSSILKRAQSELEETGSLREWCGDRRIRIIRPREVLGVRPVQDVEEFTIEVDLG